jgi:hypothetical protein
MVRKSGMQDDIPGKTTEPRRSFCPIDATLPGAKLTASQHAEQRLYRFFA